MSTRADLDDFHAFASARIGTPNELPLDELFTAWADLREHESVRLAVRRGLDDIEAGRHRPAAEALSEIWQRIERRNS